MRLFLGRRTLVRFRVCGMRRRLDHPAVPGRPAGPRPSVVREPGAVRGTRLIPEKRGGSCCGLDGADGPNMACEACDFLVGTRVDDCSLWQAVRLGSDAVHRVPVDGTHPGFLSWTEPAATGEATRLFEPIATSGGRSGAGQSCLRPTRKPTSSSYRSIPGRAGPGPPRVQPPRHTGCRCRRGCGCRWSRPRRTCRFRHRAACREMYSATTRFLCSPTLRSGSPWPPCSAACGPGGGS